MMSDDYTLYHGDCLEVMPKFEPQSVDAIITDLPYQKTSCGWDKIIPFKPMWAAVKHVLKPRGAFVTTASQPFTSALVMSNLEWFKYELVWSKTRITGHVHAKNKPMKAHENILVFSGGTTVHVSQSTDRMTYNPQGVTKKNVKTIRKNRGASDAVMSKRKSHHDVWQLYENYPNSILEFTSEVDTEHPTQKPVALYEYLIRTYTNEGDTVMDMCAGSGTTGVACMRSNRPFIGIEKEQGYFEIAQKRISEAALQMVML